MKEKLKIPTSLLHSNINIRCKLIMLIQNYKILLKFKKIKSNLLKKFCCSKWNGIEFAIFPLLILPI